MYKHHEESINKLVEMYSKNVDVLAIVLGGSIAKGQEREDSDIDAMVILSDAAYQQHADSNHLGEGIFEGCTYEGGYFDIKYFNKDYLVQAAEKGSEPTRNAFIGTKCIYLVDKEIDEIIKRIPVYQLHEKKEKVWSFYSALFVNHVFFWGEAAKRNDLYLKTRVVSDIVLFGLRLVLAYNNRLFPCHKWLMSAVNEVPNKPEGVIEKANAFLATPTDENKDIFVNSILMMDDESLDDIEFETVFPRYMEDNEWWWWKNRPHIAEW